MINTAIHCDIDIVVIIVLSHGSLLFDKPLDHNATIDLMGSTKSVSQNDQNQIYYVTLNLSLTFLYICML